MQNFIKIHAVVKSATGSDTCNSSVNTSPIREEDIIKNNFGFERTDEWGRFHKTILVSVEIDAEWLGRVAEWFFQKHQIETQKYDVLYEGKEPQIETQKCVVLKISYSQYNSYNVCADFGFGFGSKEKLAGCNKKFIKKEKNFNENDFVKVRYFFETKKVCLVNFDGIVNFE